MYSHAYNCDNDMLSFKEPPVENTTTYEVPKPTETPVEKTVSPPQGRVFVARSFVFISCLYLCLIILIMSDFFVSLTEYNTQSCSVKCCAALFVSPFAINLIMNISLKCDNLCRSWSCSNSWTSPERYVATLLPVCHRF